MSAISTVGTIFKIYKNRGTVTNEVGQEPIQQVYLTTTHIQKDGEGKILILLLAYYNKLQHFKVSIATMTCHPHTNRLFVGHIF